MDGRAEEVVREQRANFLLVIDPLPLRLRSLASTELPVTAAAAPGTRRAAASTSPGRISALLGIQPQYEHSPPTSSRSTMATERPASAQRPAAFSPAGPAPITITS